MRGVAIRFKRRRTAYCFFLYVFSHLSAKSSKRLSLYKRTVHDSCLGRFYTPHAWFVARDLRVIQDNLLIRNSFRSCICICIVHCIFGVALKHATETVTCRETSQYCVVYVRDAHKDVCAKTGKIRRADFYRGSNRYIKDGDVNDVITRLRTEWITAIGKKDSYGNRVRLGQERGSSRRKAIIIAGNDDSPRKSIYYLLLHFIQRHRFY